MIGGTHRRLTGSFVGPSAVRMIREHFVDRLFFSVTGIAPNGVLTDADELEAAVKRAMLDQAGESRRCWSTSPSSRRTAGYAIAPLTRVALVLAERRRRAHARGRRDRARGVSYLLAACR